MTDTPTPRPLTLADLKTVIDPLTASVDALARKFGETDGVLRGMNAQLGDIEARLATLEADRRADAEERAKLRTSYLLLCNQVGMLHSRLIDQADRLGSRLKAVETPNARRPPPLPPRSAAAKAGR